MTGEQGLPSYELAQGRDYSEATAARIDQEVQNLLQDRHEAVREMLTNAREELDRLAQALLKEETVDQETLARILGLQSEHLLQEKVAPVADQAISGR